VHAELRTPLSRLGVGLGRQHSILNRSLSAPLRLSLGMNAAFARFWGTELMEPGWTLPYLSAGVLPQGDTLLARVRDLPPIPSNDRPLIQAWADSLGLGSWIRWIPYAA
jgi:hypothetical protein